MDSKHLNTSTPQHFNRSTLLNIAHRGARAFAPENTIVALVKAARLGADMIELDVQLTADGRILVVHDDTLERCSDVSQRFPDRCHRPVGSFTLAEIQSLDAGSWFLRALELQPAERPDYLRSIRDDEIARYLSPGQRNRYRGGGIRTPTLQDALVRAAQHGLSVNVELKYPTAADHARRLVPASARAALVDPTVRLIQALDCCDCVLVSSFDHASLWRVKEIEPAIATGVLVDEPLADPVRYCRALAADAYHPACYGEHDLIGFRSDEYKRSGRLPTTLIGPLRDAGIAVNVWTENDPARMKCLIEAGVSGIFTDYPNRLRDVMRSYPVGP